MAVRVTAAEVEQIIDLESATTDAMIEACVLAANLTVTAVCVDSALTDEQLKEIERWLSAHLIAHRDARLASEKIGDGADKYQHKIDLGLDNTMWGQTAQALDTSGALAKLKKGRKPATMQTLDP